MISNKYLVQEFNMFEEKAIKAPNGITTILILFLLQVGTIAIVANAIITESGFTALLGVILFILVFICWSGFYMVNPKEAL